MSKRRRYRNRGRRKAERRAALARQVRRWRSGVFSFAFDYAMAVGLFDDDYAFREGYV